MERRLIDGNKMIGDLKAMKKHYDAITIDGMIRGIEKQEEVKAVEVIRCKDCVYYKDGEHFHGTKFCFRLKGKDGEPVGYNFSDDDYCSRGVRREPDGK